MMGTMIMNQSNFKKYPNTNPGSLNNTINLNSGQGNNMTNPSFVQQQQQSQNQRTGSRNFSLGQEDI